MRIRRRAHWFRGRSTSSDAQNGNPAASLAGVQRVRCRIEKILTWKRGYGLRRMRWRRLAMTSADNKSFVQSVFDELAKGNGKRFVDAMSEDFT
jgi:hypothetical protein